jgi:hypothetical protein
MVLPDHFVERLGAVFSGKDSVAHGGTLPAPHTGIQQDLRKKSAAGHPSARASHYPTNSSRWLDGVEAVVPTAC